MSEQRSRLRFVRLNRGEVIQHSVFTLSFIVLVLTGFMVYLPEGLVARAGGLGEALFVSRSSIHRAGAILMVLMSLYHLYYLAATPAGRRWARDMMPRWKDVTDVFDNLNWFLGRTSAPPRFDRFSYKAKAEYGALIFGTTMMSASGVILWSESRWSKFLIDIAQVVHEREAALACLAIMAWHMYEVSLRPTGHPRERTWLHGEISLEAADEECGAHLDRVMDDPELRAVYLRDPGPEGTSTDADTDPGGDPWQD